MTSIKIDVNIPDDYKKKIKYIVDIFNKNNFECYLIGGSVRDLLLGIPVNDYDFAVNARPETVIKLFRRVIPMGLKHGTVTVLIEDKSFEITTYRADGKYLDGRRPENISFSDTLEDDVKRRDFTINGLAYDINTGNIIDYTDGLKDLDDKIIRTIGDPIERFNEDGLRPYRACRFASKLNFDIEENTFQAISRTHDIAKKISMERIRDEFNKILKTEKPSIGIEYLRESGLLKLFLPELDDCYQVDQNKYHVHDVYYHSLYACDGAKDNFLIRLSALLHDVGKVPTRRVGATDDYTFYNHEVVGAKMVRRLMKRLKYSNEEIYQINNLILNHMFHYTDEWTDGAVRRFMKKVGVENIDDLFLLRLADRIGNGSRSGFPVPIKQLQARIEKIITEENAISVKDLKINGTIIMNKFNITPGPVIGKILNQVLEYVLDDPDINTEEELLKIAEETYNSLKDK